MKKKMGSSHKIQNDLLSQNNILSLKKSKKKYNVDGRIIHYENRQKYNLRIPEKLLDLHEFINDRKFYGEYIASDVEYYFRLYSVTFPSLHAKLLKPYLQKSTIVDAGCGQMPYINSFTEEGVEAFYGFDLSMDSLKVADHNFKKNFSLYLVQHGVYDMPVEKNSADAVISSEVIEHLDEPHKYLREIYGMLKPGGFLSISMPSTALFWYPSNFIYMFKNPLRFFKKFKEWRARLNAHKNWAEALKWHPSLKPRILRKWLREAGFEVINHRTTLYYYGSPIRITWRTLKFLEKIGLPFAGFLAKTYVRTMEKILDLNIPFIKWAGIRQFALCQKKSKI